MQGQGGCTALEDALVLARSLQEQRVPTLAAQLGDGSSSGGDGEQRRQRAAEAVQAALRRYEQQRAKRCLPLTVRSNLMGAALQVGASWDWSVHAQEQAGRQVPSVGCPLACHTRDTQAAALHNGVC